MDNHKKAETTTIDQVFQHRRKLGSYKSIPLDIKKELMSHFLESPYPSKEDLERLSRQYAIPRVQIQNWFKYQRNRDYYHEQKAIKNYRRKHKFDDQQKEYLEQTFRKKQDLDKDSLKSLWFSYRRKKLGDILEDEKRKKTGDSGTKLKLLKTEFEAAYPNPPFTSNNSNSDPCIKKERLVSYNFANLLDTKMIPEACGTSPQISAQNAFRFEPQSLTNYNYPIDVFAPVNKQFLGDNRNLPKNCSLGGPLVLQPNFDFHGTRQKYMISSPNLCQPTPFLPKLTFEPQIDRSLYLNALLNQRNLVNCHPIMNRCLNPMGSYSASSLLNPGGVSRIQPVYLPNMKMKCEDLERKPEFLLKRET